LASCQRLLAQHWSADLAVKIADEDAEEPDEQRLMFHQFVILLNFLIRK
jgi:hypothetical protein